MTVSAFCVGRVWEQLVTRPCPKLKQGMGTHRVPRGSKWTLHSCPPQTPSVQHSQTYELQPCPHLGQFQDLRNTFLFVLPIIFVILGWLIVFLTSNEKHNMGTQCSPRGMGINSDLHLCSCSGVHSQAAPAVWIYEIPFSVSHITPSTGIGTTTWMSTGWPFLSSVKSSSRKNLHNDKDICS